MDEENDTEDLINCQICCEEYSLQDRIPRFLPCTHTICEICIVQILSLESKGIYYRPQTKFAKVMFLHLSVSHSVHRAGGVHGRGYAWQGGVCGRGREWQAGCAWQGGHAWQGGMRGMHTP